MVFNFTSTIHSNTHNIWGTKVIIINLRKKKTAIDGKTGE